MLFTYIAESSADFYIVILKHHFIFRLSFVPSILYERILLQDYVYDIYRFLGCDVMSLTKLINVSEERTASILRVEANLEMWTEG